MIQFTSCKKPKWQDDTLKNDKGSSVTQEGHATVTYIRAYMKNYMFLLFQKWEINYTMQGSLALS